MSIRKRVSAFALAILALAGVGALSAAAVVAATDAPASTADTFTPPY